MQLNSYIANDITLGQYYPAEGPLHKLDPRVKLFGTFVFVIALFFARGSAGYCYGALFLLAILILSGIPPLHFFKGISSALGFIVFLAVFQIFTLRGEPLVRIGFLRITEYSLRATLGMVYRLLAILLGTSVMTFTTTPRDLTDGLEKALGFLGRTGAPVHELTMAMAIALRFIPILSEETGKIIKAQVSRGADFEEGNFFRRILNMVPLLIPLLVSAFRIAFDLSVAMEARCYNGGGRRTKMYPLKYSRKDRIAYGLILVFFAGAVIIRWVLFRN
ncbi:energy-coupling factor transporter transmembrane protein EcfT [Spirochaetia bacterium]|nr:energy-coupling factor transporter transmembrane protein EcfT [Spirochaetia bacterium]